MKKAVIIGASSGIGKELARILASDGYHVGITGRRSNLLEELAAEKPGSFIARPFDISAGEAVVQNLEELVKQLGGLDLLVICSGIVIHNEKLDFQHEKQTIDTNVLGFTNIADWAFNYFKEQKYGQLVGISSVAGLRGYRIFPAYHASKAFQIIYLEGLRNKAFHAGLPVSVTDIRAGYIKTDLMAGPYQIWVTPVKLAARQIYRAIERRKRTAYVPGRWGIIAFFLKLVPGRIHERG